LLFEKDLPKFFWAEMVNTSAYLLNILPTKVVKGKTPFEAWYGRKPSIEHLKIFGCVCYTFFSDVNRDKLDHKSEFDISFGYCNNSIGYMIYNPLKEKNLYFSKCEI